MRNLGAWARHTGEEGGQVRAGGGAAAEGAGQPTRQ